MMPPNDQEFFRVTEVTKEAAYAEIHLNCPLRGTGDGKACHALMNYDRSLDEGCGRPTGGTEELESLGHIWQGVLLCSRSDDPMADNHKANHEQNQNLHTLQWRAIGHVSRSVQTWKDVVLSV